MQGLQLPLGVHLADAASFETYHAGPNAAAVAALRALPDGVVPLLFLHGPPGSGKSHLLQALTRSTAGRRACAYVPLRALGAEAAEALQGFEAADLVCVDDVDALPPRAEDAQALLRLLDAVRAHGGRCAVAAAAPPDRLRTALPDLATRLAAGATFGLRPLSDDDRLSLLRDRARVRGLELPEDAGRLLLTRLARDTGSLLAALDALDRESLRAQRRLTLPFVQRWLQEQARVAE